jgi:hypothetical protein
MTNKIQDPSDGETNSRFDIDAVEYEKDGTPILPRIYFTVPRSCRKQFVNDMLNEVRLSLSDQLASIVIRYYRMRESAMQEATQPAQGQPGRVPVYAPKPSRPEAAQAEGQTEDAK